MLVGGGGSLRILRRMTTWLTASLALGADFLTVRKDVRVSNEPVLTTGWVVPWLGVGAGWEG